VHGDDRSRLVFLPVIDSMASRLMVEKEPEALSYSHHLTGPDDGELRTHTETSTGLMRMSSLAGISPCLRRLPIYASMASRALASTSSRVSP